MALSIIINGQPREFPELASPATLAGIVSSMALKGDRIAIELNHQIAQRATWDDTQVKPGDRLEIVHFVGGG